MKLSIIIPYFNEQQNIPRLVPEIIGIMKKNQLEGEILLIDDGSTEPTQRQEQDSGSIRVRTYTQARRMGKGLALKRGVSESSGEVLFFMDGDLQDDPADIPVFLAEIHKGASFVNGVRKQRKESGLIRLYSKGANFFLKNILKSPFTDINCGYKAMRREVAEGLPIYGNSFRFLPLAAFYAGYRIAEVPVNNRERTAGVSKFGPSKLFIGLLDMLTAYFLYQFAERPLHFFGMIGGPLFILGGGIVGILGVERIFFGTLLYRRVALQLGILLVIVGLQILMTGILGELIVYLNKTRTGKTPH